MGRRLHRFLKSEQLESRRPLAADLAALDVNDDMVVTSLDALIIINQLNQGTTAKTSTAEAEAEVQLDYDVNDDGVVSPLDVLNVVNQINTGVIAVPSSVTAAVVSIDPTTDPNNGTVDETTPTDGTVTEDPTTETPVTEDPVDTPPTDDSGTDSPEDNTDDNTGDDTTDDDTTDDEPDDTTDAPTDDDTTDAPTDTPTDPPTNDGNCDHGHGDAGRRGLLAPSGHHGRGDRGDIFDDLDANGDGALSSTEVPAKLWAKLSAADADGSDSVTQAELDAYREAQRVAAVEAFFGQLDKDGSGAITSTDVSRLAWRFLSRADANNDGSVTVDELLAVPMPGRW